MGGLLDVATDCVRKIEPHSRHINGFCPPPGEGIVYGERRARPDLSKSRVVCFDPELHWPVAEIAINPRFRIVSRPFLHLLMDTITLS